KKLDIGTAKITKSQMQGVPHHLIDIANIDEIYTAADFKRDAQIAISDITTRGMLPVITGGTCFYIDALLERTSTPEVPPNEALRSELESLSIDALNERLAKIDPTSAADIDTTNKRRLIRSIEIAETLGFVPEPKETESAYDFLMLGIVADKDELRTRFKE